MLWRALRQVTSGFYIDVGANDPCVDSVTRLFYEHGWNGINIEPLSRHFIDLQRARPRDINLQCAAGPESGSLEIWDCGVRGWATADMSVVKAHESQGRTGKFSTVPMATLAAICAQHAPPDIHFLKVDVEGFERAVLLGMDFNRFRPWVVVVEATLPNTTAEAHKNWEGLLLEARYQAVYADGLNRFYLARERDALADRFAHPPNVFDEFVLASRLEAETRAVLAENCLDQALERAAQAEIRTALILNSSSWRMTAPLRWLMDLRVHMMTKAIGTARVRLQRGMVALAARPELRRRAVKVLQRYPSLKNRLKALTSTAGRKSLDPMAPLPVRIRAICDELVQAAGKVHGIQSLALRPMAPGRPKLAYVSPLPPQRSGIADYSAQLLPELLKYYQIDVVVQQDEVAVAWLGEQCVVRSVDWFLENASQYDRVVYHFGNSGFHNHMFKMLDRVPGVIVLHDFFLGGVLLEVDGSRPGAMSRALYISHGYAALAERFSRNGESLVVGKYPANFEVVCRPHGVIVHSGHATDLAKQWYGPNLADDWSVIPLLRSPQTQSLRDRARLALGLAADEFLVCCFGLMAPSKLNNRLLDAWFASHLARDESCTLVFVGEAHHGEFGKQMARSIESSEHGRRVRVLGWTHESTFTNYLAAADLAVQLRSQSRGESSAAVLDCMNHGVATIVNAHGSFADLPRDGVWMLPEIFDTPQLTDSIEALWRNARSRMDLGMRGRNWVMQAHAPQVCAAQYARAIERGYAAAAHHAEPMRNAMQACNGRQPAMPEVMALAQAVALAQPHRTSARQWLIDVSGTYRSDPKTGIQRVVRSLVWALIKAPPAGCRIEPVYLSDEGGRWHYRYAREWTCGALSCPSGWMPDDPVDFCRDDLLLIADFISELAAFADHDGVFQSVRQQGARIHFFVYDLLPLQMPHCFPPNQFGYGKWLDTLARVADGAMCISESVAQDLRAWLPTSGPQRDLPLRVDWFHLGADIEHSIPTAGVTRDFDATIARLKGAPSFLMVGTLEPRKGYLQTIEAFSRLWQDGHEVNLVIVGTEGWRGMPDEMRRTIPEIMNTLRSHRELGKRLLWLNGISDECLEKVYAASSCLIAASEGEGFGLPLIEAAQHRLPVIARNIPVFKEVAGPHATYFEGLAPEQLANAVLHWLELHAIKKNPDSSKLPWLTWEQSAITLVQKLNAMDPKETHAPGI